MKTALKYLLSICLLAGTFACDRRDGGVGEPVEPPYRIALESAIDDQTPTGVTAIGTSIAYLPLETSPEALLGSVRRVHFTDSMIFALDREDQLKVFDRAGKLLRRIGRQGNGPGEYHNINDFGISPDGKKIYHFGGERGLFEHDMEGRFLQNYPVAQDPDTGYASDFIALDNDSFMFVNRDVPANMAPFDARFFIYDLDRGIVTSYKAHHKLPSGYMSMYGVAPYAFEGNVRHTERGSDTLYTVTPDGIGMYARFDLGKRAMTDRGRMYAPPAEGDAFRAAWEDYYFVDGVVESSEAIFVTLFNFSNNLYSFFDKNTGATSVIGRGGFTNNFDGGMDFFPRYVAPDGTLVSWVDAYRLKEHVERLDTDEMTRLHGERFERLADLAAGMKEDDNPVLIMVK